MKEETHYYEDLNSVDELFRKIRSVLQSRHVCSPKRIVSLMHRPDDIIMFSNDKDSRRRTLSLTDRLTAIRPIGSFYNGVQIITLADKSLAVYHLLRYVDLECRSVLKMRYLPGEELPLELEYQHNPVMRAIVDAGVQIREIQLMCEYESRISGKNIRGVPGILKTRDDDFKFEAIEFVLLHCVSDVRALSKILINSFSAVAKQLSN